MLIPRFTLRWMLAITAVVAAFAWIASLAVRGSIWAVAVCVAAGSVPAMFLLYAIVFAAAFMMARALERRRVPPHGDTPFATATPPPQLVPPRDPE